MANINEIMNNLYSDIKAVGQEVGRRTGDALEISRLRLEHLKIKNRITENYERLGEIVYGGYKSGEDVSDAVAAVYNALDEDFVKIEHVFAAIKSVKAGYANFEEAEAKAKAEDEAEPCEDEKAAEEPTAESVEEPEKDEAPEEADKEAKKDESLNIDAD